LSKIKIEKITKKSKDEIITEIKRDEAELMQIKEQFSHLLMAAIHGLTKQQILLTRRYRTLHVMVN